MKCGFGKDRLASQDRPFNLLCDFHGPIVILILVSCNRHEQTCVRDGIHPRENPLREETSGGPPLITPAYFLQGCALSFESVVSSAWRTTRPTGSPVRREICRSRSRSSLG